MSSNEPTTEPTPEFVRPMDFSDLSLGGSAMAGQVPLIQDIETRKAHLYDASCGMSRYLNGAENIPGMLGTVQLLGTLLLSRQALDDIERECPDIVDRADRLSLLRSALKDRFDELKELSKAIKTGQTEIDNIIYGMSKLYGHTMRAGDAEKAKRERANAKSRKDGDADFDENEGGDDERPKEDKPAKAKRGRPKAADKAADAQAAEELANRPNFGTRQRLFAEEPVVNDPPSYASTLSPAEQAAAGEILAADDKASAEPMNLELDPEPMSEDEKAEGEAKISASLLGDDDFDFAAPTESTGGESKAPSSTTHGDPDLTGDATEFGDDLGEPVGVPMLSDSGYNADAKPAIVDYEGSIQVLIENTIFDAQSDDRQRVLYVGFPGDKVFVWDITWDVYKSSHDGKEYAMTVVPWATARVLLRALSTKDRENKKEIGLGIPYHCRIEDNKPAALRSRAGAPPKLPEVIPA